MPLVIFLIAVAVCASSAVGLYFLVFKNDDEQQSPSAMLQSGAAYAGLPKSSADIPGYTQTTARIRSRIDALLDTYSNCWQANWVYRKYLPEKHIELWKVALQLEKSSNDPNKLLAISLAFVLQIRTRAIAELSKCDRDTVIRSSQGKTWTVGDVIDAKVKLI